MSTKAPRKSTSNAKAAGAGSHKHPRIKVRSDKRVTLSPRESTEITGFGLTQTYRMLRDGTMPSIRVGKQFFIPHHALMGWLNSCGQAVTEE
jgi:excisionase family DNA binding protein